MTKIKEVLQNDIKFWLTIGATIVSITAWGIRLETRLDYISAQLNEHTNDQKEFVSSINRLWKNIIAINTILKIPTQ